MKHMGATSTKMAYESGLKVFVIVLMGLCLPGIWYSLGLVQAASPITSSGLNTQVTLSAAPPAGKTQYDITGGTRPGGGKNLFHSFGDFNIPNNNIANFLNDSGLATSNILGRVTGGNISNIFGTIQTTGFGNANLFMMNPAGFLFGPNATVNVGGMVAFTSADYLRLADGVLFNAVPNAAADALLSAAPVAAFGFLGSNPGAIMVQGSQLSVSTGQGLSLVGGNITVQNGTLDNGTVQVAKLSAPGGQIQLASVVSPGEVVVGTLDYAPNINGQSFGALGSINISQQSVIDVSGNGGGTVLIRGGQFVLDNSTISANVTGPGPVTNGVESVGGGIDIQVNQDAVIQNRAVLQTNVSGNVTPGFTYGGVKVNADHIEIVGIGTAAAFTGIRSDVSNSPGGSSGDITLDANSILIKGVGLLDTRVTGSATQPATGNAGNINVTANQNIELDGSQIASVITNSSGTGGNITFTSRHGNIVESGNALPPGFSPTPGVPIPPVQLNVIFDQANGSSTGKPGNLTFNAPEGDIVLAGAIMPISIGTSVQAAGGGQLHFTANNLQLINNSSVQVDNFSPLPAGSFNLALNGNLTLNSSRIVTTARGPAQAADLNITAHDVLVTQGGLLSTQTASSGPGGHLNILADTIQVTNRGQITSGSPFPVAGSGGTININGLTGPASSVLIDGAGSGIFTNTVGTGAAGNTNITAQSVTIQNSGTITAATSGTAPSAIGGTILVKADTVTLNTGGTMTAASTGAGASGEVIVQGLASPAQSILIDGAGSGIFTNAQGTAAGGDIHLFANSVTLQNGGTLSAATSGTASSATGGTITVEANQVQINNGGLITASTTGAGAGGSITIGADSTFTSNAGTVSSTATQATGGDINITSGQSVALTNGASISASSTGAGNAGNISINAGNQFGMTNSSVTTQANQASGGTIKITTNPGGTVQLTNSTISASVLDGTGGGGSVNIDPQFVILQNSQILAQAIQGPGGNISITTNLLLPDSNSSISASSQFGQNGTITIQSPISPAGGKILPLSQRPRLATGLLSQRCAALAGGEFSSFTVAGRDSLPAEPGGWLASPLALALSESGGGTLTESGGHASDGEPGRETPLLSLRQIAPPGFLTQAFAADWSAGCTS